MGMYHIIIPENEALIKTWTGEIPSLSTYNIVDLTDNTLTLHYFPLNILKDNLHHTTNFLPPNKIQQIMQYFPHIIPVSII